MAITTQTVFGPVSPYKEFVTVVASVSGSDTVTIEMELDTDDWTPVQVIDANSAVKYTRVFTKGERLRVTPTGAASFVVRGL